MHNKIARFEDVHLVICKYKMYLYDSSAPDVAVVSGGFVFEVCDAHAFDQELRPILRASPVRAKKE